MASAILLVTSGGPPISPCCQRQCRRMWRRRSVSFPALVAGAWPPSPPRQPWQHAWRTQRLQRCAPDTHRTHAVLTSQNPFHAHAGTVSTQTLYPRHLNGACSYRIGIHRPLRWATEHLAIESLASRRRPRLQRLRQRRMGRPWPRKVGEQCVRPQRLWCAVLPSLDPPVPHPVPPSPLFSRLPPSRTSRHLPSRPPGCLRSCSMAARSTSR